MKIRISSTQWEVNYTFKMNHRINRTLENYLNKFIRKENIKSDYDEIVFDISVTNTDEDYRFGKKSKFRKTNDLIQYCYLNSKFLVRKDEFVLHPKKFDFVKKELNYRTIEVQNYVEQVIHCISTYLSAPKMLKLARLILKKIENNSFYCKYRNEEIEHLEFLLSKEGENWLKTKNGQDFSKSEVYPKWQFLLNKYKLNDQGMVNFEEYS